jgi:hypothetical protein
MNFRSPSLFIFLTLVPSVAHADDPVRGPTQAFILTPLGIEHAVFDRYPIVWSDGDDLTASPSATVDLFFTPQNPPAFVLGSLPPALTGVPIAGGIAVWDPRNTFIWDTSLLPSGAYWVWSEVQDPDVPAATPSTIAFSPGVVVVDRGDGLVPPVVVLVAPADPYLWPPTNMLDVEYLAFDPDGTAKIEIDAQPAFDDAAPWVVLAAGVPPELHGGIIWDTSHFAGGEWRLRATIIDARGLGFVAYDRFFRVVNHPAEGAGSGCACSAVEPNRSAIPFAIVLLLSIAWSARRQRLF